MDTNVDSPPPAPPSSAPAKTTAAAFIKESVLKAPERERMQAQSPLKFSAAEKRRHRESDGSAASTTTATTAATTAAVSDCSLAPDAGAYTRQLEKRTVASSTNSLFCRYRWRIFKHPCPPSSVPSPRNLRTCPS